jgi:hypothetical protein
MEVMMITAVIEHIEHPFARGNLTSNGVQWSAEHTTTTDNYEEVESVTITPPALGEVIEYEFGLTGAVKSSGAAEAVLFKWQARNKGGTWVDLHGEVSYPANASSYREYTYSGRFSPGVNLDSIPFDVRLVVKSGGAGGESATGKTKGSSYVKVIYAAS